MKQPWNGFWQMLTDDEDVDFVPLRDTTVAIRSAAGFSVYTGDHFIELLTQGKCQPPATWPPTEAEAVEMYPHFYAIGGSCSWTELEEGWLAEHNIEMASDPRIEGISLSYTVNFQDNHCLCKRAFPDGKIVEENWRKLSGAGDTPLAGAWESEDKHGRWMSLVTQGHYGVMRAGTERPRAPSQGVSFSDTEIYKLFNEFGVNVGARLETPSTFDNWPFLSQVPGYETRKHESFHIKFVDENRLIMSIPPYIPEGAEGEWWRKVKVT